LARDWHSFGNIVHVTCLLIQERREERGERREERGERREERGERDNCK
jgi:hypothetical protein